MKCMYIHITCDPKLFHSTPIQWKTFTSPLFMSNTVLFHMDRNIYIYIITHSNLLKAGIGKLIISFDLFNAL